ncbi:MAG TPA: class I SAM-dependent methyltransferase [Polyangiaceae bacterium]
MTVTEKAYKKPYKGLPMEGLIANWYARNTKSDVRHRGCADALMATLPAGARVLELAPGPGYLAIELAKRGAFRVSGLDISESFVRIARDNAGAEGLAIDFRQGNASQMPYPDESFDFVVCQAAFKNFTDPLGALNETYRVLVPGGRASIYDLRKEATLADVDAEVKGMNLSPASALFTRFVFRSVLLKNAYREDALQRLVAESRFGSGELRRQGIGFELRLVKGEGEQKK